MLRCTSPELLICPTITISNYFFLPSNTLDYPRRLPLLPSRSSSLLSLLPSLLFLFHTTLPSLYPSSSLDTCPSCSSFYSFCSLFLNIIRTSSPSSPPALLPSCLPLSLSFVCLSRRLINLYLESALHYLRFFVVMTLISPHLISFLRVLVPQRLLVFRASCHVVGGRREPTGGAESVPRASLGAVLCSGM